MITLRCDMCGYECLLANIQKLPTGWKSIEHNELCETCVNDYHEFKNDLDAKHIVSIKKYFDKGEK